MDEAVDLSQGIPKYRFVEQGLKSLEMFHVS
jgi:hypothetical protein